MGDLANTASKSQVSGSEMTGGLLRNCMALLIRCFKYQSVRGRYIKLPRAWSMLEGLCNYFVVAAVAGICMCGFHPKMVPI